MWEPTSCCLIYTVQQVTSITWCQQGNKTLIKLTIAKDYKKETFLHSSINVNLVYFSPFALLEILLLVISKYVYLNLL